MRGPCLPSSSPEEDPAPLQLLKRQMQDWLVPAGAVPPRAESPHRAESQPACPAHLNALGATKLKLKLRLTLTPRTEREGRGEEERDGLALELAPAQGFLLDFVSAAGREESLKRRLFRAAQAVDSGNIVSYAWLLVVCCPLSMYQLCSALIPTQPCSGPRRRWTLETL